MAWWSTIYMAWHSGPSTSASSSGEVGGLDSDFFQVPTSIRDLRYAEFSETWTFSERCTTGLVVWLESCWEWTSFLFLSRNATLFFGTLPRTRALFIIQEIAP